MFKKKLVQKDKRSIIDTLSKLRKNLECKIKKHQHRNKWFVQCVQFHIPYSTIEADLQFDMQYMMSKSAHRADEKQVDIPFK